MSGKKTRYYHAYFLLGLKILRTIQFKSETITPSKIICVGRNYSEHAKELGNEVPTDIVFFVKPNSAIADRLISFHQEALHYELEMSFLVKNDHLCGVGLGIDLTKRALQTKLKNAGLPWERAKAFDGSAIFSQFLDLPQNLSGLNIELYIDDMLVQKGHVEQMLFKPEHVLKDCMSFISLNDGDIIMTGTPQGVGEIKQGAIFKALLFDQQKVVLSVEWKAF